jgi:type I restriction enzyme R subunit
LKDRLTKGKERLDDVLEAIALICEPVLPPKDNLSYIRYFCGNPENPQDLQNSEMRRVALYKHTVALIRAYANIADEMSEAGYGDNEITAIKTKIDKYLKLTRIFTPLIDIDYLPTQAVFSIIISCKSIGYHPEVAGLSSKIYIDI